MRTFIIGFLALLSGAAASGATPPPEGPEGSHSGHRAQWRSDLERDAAAALGAAVMAEIRSARSALLVRGPVSFPYMDRQPDGSYRPQRPAFAAGVRGSRGWIRIGADGTRQPFDAATGRELDRLLSSPGLWSGPAAEARCTDPGGALVLARRPRHERVSAFPCGFEGPTGRAAKLVLAGGITDWSEVPAEQRPAGLPLERFDERTASAFRAMSGLYEERMIVLRSRAEWQGQWRRITARQGEPPPLPPVDFEREMLLMAAMGPKPSGGYRVVIDKVVDQRGELLAFVRFVSPGRRCGAIAAVTSPVDIVRVPASAKNVRWVVEGRAGDCP
ncbi:MAG TPA: protease complex subunit PrcB family protein [Allosphingosinicella sp.]|nr:protease complex subunit PrcB family protein [Allosphingosinicella sp.]